jgi:hypothetical protein
MRDAATAAPEFMKKGDVELSTPQLLRRQTRCSLTLVALAERVADCFIASITCDSTQPSPSTSCTTFWASDGRWSV